MLFPCLSTTPKQCYLFLVGIVRNSFKNGDEELSIRIWYGFWSCEGDIFGFLIKNVTFGKTGLGPMSGVDETKTFVLI